MEEKDEITMIEEVRRCLEGAQSGLDKLYMGQLRRRTWRRGWYYEKSYKLKEDLLVLARIHRFLSASFSGSDRNE